MHAREQDSVAPRALGALPLDADSGARFLATLRLATTCVTVCIERPDTVRAAMQKFLLKRSLIYMQIKAKNIYYRIRSSSRGEEGSHAPPPRVARLPQKEETSSTHLPPNKERGKSGAPLSSASSSALLVLFSTHSH